MSLAVIDVAGAQDPVKLPEVLVKGDAGRRISGVVRDTMHFTLDGAEITIPKLRLRVMSGADGSFRFDSLPKGTFDVRARKIGYGPQILTIKVENQSGSMSDFALVPIPHALPPVVTSAGRLGLSGVVADTAFQNVNGAMVKVMPSALKAETDSMGSFFLPVPPGKYMVTITKPSFKDRVMSVTIPSDSGRRITVSMLPYDGKRPSREAWNLPDLDFRLSFPYRRNWTYLFTREQLQKMGIVWASDALTPGAQQVDFTGADDALGGRDLDPLCYAIVDGGPTVALISSFTVDEIESIEVYNKSAMVELTPPPMTRKAVPTVRIGKTQVADSRPSNPLSDPTTKELLKSANRGRNCPIVYIWQR